MPLYPCWALSTAALTLPDTVAVEDSGRRGAVKCKRDYHHKTAIKLGHVSRLRGAVVPPPPSAERGYH